jgi:hypothetical protein
MGGHLPGRTFSSFASTAVRLESEFLSCQGRALELWNEGLPISGTIAAQYLASRGITEPARTDREVLRFHRSCPFGEQRRHPCLLALMRDIQTDEPRAIYRTALTPAGEKIGRMALGPKRGAAIKLSPDHSVAMSLTIGEGLETVLSGCN